MSRRACINKFGIEDGDAFYKRFHTMKTKARHSGTPFQWESFDDFWVDFIEVAPPEFDPKTHRFKFTLDNPNGYCRENMEIHLKYFGKSGKVNPKVASALVEQMFKQPGAQPTVVTTELVNRIVDKARRVDKIDLAVDQDAVERAVTAAVEQAVELATEIAWKLDRDERQSLDRLVERDRLVEHDRLVGMN